MDLKAQILEEHSKTNTHRIASFIDKNPKQFHNLMELFFNGEYRLSQRAAWIMSLCVEKRPALIGPYLEKIINYIPDPHNHPAIKRNSLRVLQFVEVPERLKGSLVAICFDLLENKKEPIAVQVFAMSVLYELIKDEPDLKRELKIIIEDRMPLASAGFRSRGRKILARL